MNCHQVAASHNVYGVLERKGEGDDLDSDPIECWSNSGDRKEKDDVDSISVAVCNKSSSGS